MGKRSDFDKAIDTILAWDGKVPPIANATPQSVLDEIGYLKEVQKAAEKVENILWGRLSTLQGGGHPTNSKGVPTPDPLEGDKFKYTLASSDREAVNQGMVKAFMEQTHACPSCGTVLQTPNFMSVTSVYTKTVKRLGA